MKSKKINSILIIVALTITACFTVSIYFYYNKKLKKEKVFSGAKFVHTININNIVDG